MLRFTLLPVLAACASGKIYGSGSDTAGTADTDGGAASDSASDSGGDGGESEQSEPKPDYSVWNAELSFSYDTWGDAYDCTGDTMAETGEALESGNTWEDMAALCPSCTWFYETRFERTTACDWIELPEGDLRGVALGDGWAAVYRFDETDAGLELVLMDSAADFDGWTFSFEHSFDYWVEVQVAGTVTYPEADSQ